MVNFMFYIFDHNKNKINLRLRRDSPCKGSGIKSFHNLMNTMYKEGETV